MSERHWSIDCLAYGSGQCDGYIYEGRHKGEPCACPCHTQMPTMRTIEAVKAWHDVMHGVV